MTPEDILDRPPVAISDEEKRAYFRDGYVALPGATPPDLLQRIRDVSAEFLERSRSVTESNDVFDLGPEHSPEKPHVRRLRRPVDQHPFFWELATSDFMTGIAADLVGPDVRFHSAKLNYKWPGGGEVVKWHQDILSWPHTNYSPVTLGIYLDDVDEPVGPLACVKGSHDGPLHSQYDASGQWVGHISDSDAEASNVAGAASLTGPAGTVIAINCRTIHGSMENRTDKVRPLLLYVYSSADAFPFTAAPTPTNKTGEIVRGGQPFMAHMDPRPCPVPPDWSKQAYGSIFSIQNASME